jgi:hypothetical protein
VGRAFDLPVRSISPAEADDHFGFLGRFAQLDNPVSAAITRELVGWDPVRPGLLADLTEGRYGAVTR